MIAVAAPSLLAAIHWLAPFPPYFISYLLPIIVSPDFGKRGEKLEKKYNLIAVEDEMVHSKVNIMKYNNKYNKKYI